MKRTSHDRENRNGIGSDRVRKGEQESSSSESEAGTVAALHRAVGNQTIQRIHGNNSGNTPLDMGEPSDPAEREAQKIASEVMQIDGSSEPVTASEENQGNTNGSVRSSKSLNRSTTGGKVSIEKESTVRRGVQGSGKPLPENIRSDFEAKMGANFSHVRLHTDSKADEAAKSINAEAYTMGSDIAFANGKYKPMSNSGRELLAHELTHVVQQGLGVPQIQREGGEGGEQADLDVSALPSDYAEAVKDASQRLSDEQKVKMKQRIASKVGPVEKGWPWNRVVSYLINTGRVLLMGVESAVSLAGLAGATGAAHVAKLITFVQSGVGLAGLAVMVYSMMSAWATALKGYQQEAKAMASSYGIVHAIKKLNDGPPSMPSGLTEEAQANWLKGYYEGLSTGHKFVYNASTEQKLILAAIYDAGNRETEIVLNAVWDKFKTNLPGGPSKRLAPESLSWPEPTKTFETPELGRDRSDIHGGHDVGGPISSAIEWFVGITGPDIRTE